MEPVKVYCLSTELSTLDKNMRNIFRYNCKVEKVDNFHDLLQRQGICVLEFLSPESEPPSEQTNIPVDKEPDEFEETKSTTVQVETEKIPGSAENTPPNLDVNKETTQYFISRSGSRSSIGVSPVGNATQQSTVGYELEIKNNNATRQTDVMPLYVNQKGVSTSTLDSNFSVVPVLVSSQPTSTQTDDTDTSRHNISTAESNVESQSHTKEMNSHNSGAHEVVSTSITSHSPQRSENSALKSSTVRTGSPPESQLTNEVGKAQLVIRRATDLKLHIKHALHHHLHTEENCPYYSDGDQCKQNYDKETTESFKHYLNGWKFCDKDYDGYIIDHLASKMCGLGCPLWKYYIQNEMYLTHNSVLKYADEGLVIHSSHDKGTVGTISTDYADYDENNPIGSGGSGKVYQYTGRFAVKEEFKKPLIIADPDIFKRVTRLQNDYVISMKEYLVGKEIGERKHAFLLVMPYMNKRGLHEQFKTHKCVIDYMIHFPDEEANIFDNYLTLFLHVFKGLEYLHSEGIVHGDVKDANILVQQSCSCASPLQCKCHGHIGVNYILTDMDLFCLDGQSLTGKYVEWEEMKLSEPPGTYGMKASELYFTGEKGEPCGSRKSDIWSGCVTMMKALVGRQASDEATKQMTAFFGAVTISGKKYVTNIDEACNIVKMIQRKVEIFDLMQERPQDIPYLNNKTAEIVEDFKKIRKLLRGAQREKETRHISTYTYPKKFPLELILSAVHVANSLHQNCLDQLEHVYTAPLWDTMKKLMQIITDGVRFLPQNRPEAKEVTEKITALLLGFN